MISLQNVTKRFGTKTALSNISMDIPDNQIIGIVGPNGAGKSTLLKILTGILNADSGLCSFNGKYPLESCIANNIGYLPEQRGLYNAINVRKQLFYFAALRGMRKKDAIAAIDKWSSIFAIERWQEKRVSELSKGMQQKIQLITCLLHNPKFVFMDEPLSGIDPLNFEIFTNVIIEYRQKNQATIVLSTHNMKSIEKMCDKIAFINESTLKMFESVDLVKNKYADNSSYKVILSSNTEIDKSKVNQKLYPFFKTNEITNLAHELTQLNLVCNIRKSNSTDSISLIVQLLSEYNVISCQLYVPTMDEIFIKLTEK